MAKATLFHVLARPRWGHGGEEFRLIAVTSEKGRQLYGRDMESEAVTHISVSDVLHRFAPDTPADHVLASRARATAARKLKYEAVRIAEKTAQRLHDEMRADILAAASRPWSDEVARLRGPAIDANAWTQEYVQAPDARPRTHGPSLAEIAGDEQNPAYYRVYKGRVSADWAENAAAREHWTKPMFPPRTWRNLWGLLT